MHSCGSGYGPVARSGEQANEPLGPVKDGKLFDFLSDC
jgi:hypothetical protein